MFRASINKTFLRRFSNLLVTRAKLLGFCNFLNGASLISPEWMAFVINKFIWLTNPPQKYVCFDDQMPSAQNARDFKCRLRRISWSWGVSGGLALSPQIVLSPQSGSKRTSCFLTPHYTYSPSLLLPTRPSTLKDHHPLNQRSNFGCPRVEVLVDGCNHRTPPQRPATKFTLHN